ncbi:DUF416 family protein [Sorangium sp. So ce406]|uniref:DUF416 family protein n=1 Tax=Sorangium sp. So ce406 TaxID=3133311 RepID=UPI003F5CB854
MMPTFDEQALVRRLRPLPWFCSLAFGAACASRLVPNYRRFVEATGWGDIRPIIRALDLVWGVARAQTSLAEAECRALAGECESHAPDSEDFNSLFTSSAQDAVFAVCSLLDYCAEGKPEQVALAARYATDSVDLYVQEIEQMAPQDPTLEAKILAHPLMQQELERQSRDLVALESVGASAVVQLLSRRTIEEAFG